MGFTHLDRNQEAPQVFLPNSINHPLQIVMKCDSIFIRCMSEAERRRYKHSRIQAELNVIWPPEREREREENQSISPWNFNRLLCQVSTTYAERTGGEESMHYTLQSKQLNRTGPRGIMWCLPACTAAHSKLPHISYQHRVCIQKTYVTCTSV